MANTKHGEEKVDVIDPQAVFQNATRFDYASTVLLKVANDHIKEAKDDDKPYQLDQGYLPHTLLPSAVTSAFAIELYLKAMLFLKPPDDYKASHDLESLYRQLDDADRTAVATAYASELAKHPETLDRRRQIGDNDYFDLSKLLARYKGVFDLARYAHEYKSIPFDVLLPLREALRSLIQSRRPDWNPDGGQTGQQPTYRVR